MGRYSVQQAPRKEAPKGPHPIWNGLGCLMLIVIPLISIGLSFIALDVIQANKWPFPYQLLGYPRFPSYFYSTVGLAEIFGAIDGIQNLYAYIALSLVFMVILGGVVSFLYALVYRMVGPSKYGPTDVPPVKIRVTKKQR